MDVLVIRWKATNGDEAIVGVFDDDDMAHRTFDALEQHGAEDKHYYIDSYKLNEIKKGN